MASTPSTDLTIRPYLRKALRNHPFATIYNDLPLQSSALHINKPNNIALYTGFFNPPHLGHLATILYFAGLRQQLNFTALFVYCDPDDLVSSSSKAYNTVTLSQAFRCAIFASQSEIKKLMDEGWLYFVLGDMGGHVNMLRSMTDGIREAGWKANLVALLVGDKVSRFSAMHEKPAKLQDWGEVDKVLTINARRPVDYFTPGEDEVPHNVPQCTSWERVADTEEDEVAAGVLWRCTSLSLDRNLVVEFRASLSSASNGVSGTKIRRIMEDAPDEDLEEALREHVVNAGMLAVWLVEDRAERRTPPSLSFN